MGKSFWESGSRYGPGLARESTGVSVRQVVLDKRLPLNGGRATARGAFVVCVVMSGSLLCLVD